MKKALYILWAVTIVYLDMAFIFKFMHWPGGNTMFIVSSFMLIPLTVITAVYLCIQDSRKNKRNEHE